MDDSRRSAAAQFFMDDDSGQGRERPNYNKVISLLNEATLCPDPQMKLEILNRVQDLLLNKEPTLLQNFVAEILAFQHDRNGDIRKFVVGFIEEAIKKDCEILPDVIVNIQMLLQDRTPQVQKRVVQCVTQLYRIVLMWLARAPSVTENMQKVWSVSTSMKGFIINMVDSENDGLRTQIVKFLEMLVLLQTYPEADSIKRNNDFSLEDVPLTLKVARRRKLEEEAMSVFDLMIKFHGSHHISSANLMACMGSLTTIAKLRPIFMGKVVAALETLHMTAVIDDEPPPESNYSASCLVTGLATSFFRYLCGIPLQMHNNRWPPSPHSLTNTASVCTTICGSTPIGIFSGCLEKHCDIIDLHRIMSNLYTCFLMPGCHGKFLVCTRIVDLSKMLAAKVMPTKILFAPCREVSSRCGYYPLTTDTIKSYIKNLPVI